MNKAPHFLKGRTQSAAGNSSMLSGKRTMLPLVLALACGVCLPAQAAAQETAEADTAAASSAATSQDTPRREAEGGDRDRAEDVQRAVDRIFQEPLSGVVVNRTVTVLGKDFYRYFSNYWRVNPESARYSISIHERPTARFGSEIWVLYRQQRMFHIFLPPARQATRDISEIAVEHVLENIQRRELERLTTRNPDLGPEEL